MALTNETKQKLKGIWKPLLKLVIIIVLIRLLSRYIPSLASAIIIIGAFTTLEMLWYHRFTWKGWLKSILILTVTIYIMISLFTYSIKWGFLGLLGSCTLVALWKLFGSKEKRKKYFSSLEEIQRGAYGKTWQEMKDDGEEVRFFQKRGGKE